MKRHRVFFACLWLVSVILIVFVGTIEAQRANDLATGQSITDVSRKISIYAKNNKKLPESLEAANITAKEGVSYKKIDDTKYELCAVFRASQTEYSRNNERLDSEIYHVGSHKKGNDCFKAEPQHLVELKNNTKQTNRVTTFQQRSQQSAGQNLSHDAERQTDIKVLHGQIEASYARNGRYPTLRDINTTTFRSTNMNGLDIEALKDPVGKTASLLAKPSINYYSYEVKSANGGTCDNISADCVRYTLTAILEGGGVYAKQSLN